MSEFTTSHITPPTPYDSPIVICLSSAVHHGRSRRRALPTTVILTITTHKSRNKHTEKENDKIDKNHQKKDITMTHHKITQQHPRT